MSLAWWVEARLGVAWCGLMCCGEAGEGMLRFCVGRFGSVRLCKRVTQRVMGMHRGLAA